jgi:hypothetical protein
LSLMKQRLRITAYIAWSLENTEYGGPAVDRAVEFVEKHMGGATDAHTRGDRRSRGRLRP